MAMRVNRYNPQDENAAAISGKSVAPPASIQRPKLSNITNKQQLLPSATPKPKLGSKIDTGRTPLRNISNNLGSNLPGAAARHLTPLKDSILKPAKQQRTVEKRQSPKGEKQRYSRMRSGPFSIPEAATIQAEIWSGQGIEKVHFTGDDMEDLRQELEHQEMENRVKAVLSFRTEIFPPRQSVSTIEGPFGDDGKLKLGTRKAPT